MAWESKFSPGERTNYKKQQIKELKDTLNKALQSYQQHPEQIAELLSFRSKFYNYSLRNAELIQKQNNGATFVASFNDWKEKGFTVNKGQHGIKIFVPTLLSVFKALDENGNEYLKRVTQATPAEKTKIAAGEIKTRQQIYYKIGSVFDISQTSCPVEEYPKFYSMGYASEQHAALYNAVKKFAAGSGLSVLEGDVKSISLRGFYMPNENAITISDKLNDSEKLSTLTHELGHAIMALNFSDKEFAANMHIREFEADAISIALQSAVGLSLTTSRINHFKEHYGACAKLGDEFHLEQCLGEIDTAFRGMYQKLSPYLEEVRQIVAPVQNSETKAQPQTEATEKLHKPAPGDILGRLFSRTASSPSQEEDNTQDSIIKEKVAEKQVQQEESREAQAAAAVGAAAAVAASMVPKGRIRDALIAAGVDKALADAAALSAQKTLLQAQPATCILYQIANEKSAEFGKSLLSLEKSDLGVRQRNYKVVYTAELAAGETLDALYARLNLDTPEDFKVRPIGIGDVITVERGGEKQAFFLDTDGFQEVPEFLTKIPNHSLSERIDEVLAGKTERASDIYVCDTPKVLMDYAGMKQLPMFLSQSHLKKIVSSNGHAINPKQVKSLEFLLRNPVIVMDSMTVPGSKVVVTEEKDASNRPIVVAIKPDGHGRYELSQMSSNFITSMYGRNDFLSFDESGKISPDCFLGRAVSQHKIICVDKEKSHELKKSHELIGEAGLQLPGAFISHDSFIPSISKNEPNVNTSEPSDRENFSGSEGNEVRQNVASASPQETEKEVIGAPTGPNNQEAAYYREQRKKEQQRREELDYLKSRVNILDLASDLGYTVIKNGTHHVLKEHPSCTFYQENGSNSFYRFSRGYGGSTIDFVLHMNEDDNLNLSLHTTRDAIEYLKNRYMWNRTEAAQRSSATPVKRQSEAEERKPFILPQRAEGQAKHMFAYLTKTRAIDREILQDCVKRGLCYEDTSHNSVFVGKDKDGKDVFATRHTSMSDSSWKRDVAGSDESCGWYVNNNAHRLYVTEAPIDALSMMTLLKQNGQDLDSANYLATTGTGKLSVLYKRLEEDPEIHTVVLAFDNDNAGSFATGYASEEIKRSYPDKEIKIYPIPAGKDVNAYLQQKTKTVAPDLKKRDRIPNPGKPPAERTAALSPEF
ncbi:MAG: YodL domain-containing protein [Oscillospiraceae bacterium]|jgi:hypothetical protein|nr:YodL domain-containing protein [Oscillospiraceae bacterium]